MAVDLSYPLSIDTLGKVHALGMRLSVYCHNYLCHRHTWLDMEDMIARFGEDHSSMHDDLKPHFFCSQCRALGKPDRNIAFTLHIKTPAPPTDSVLASIPAPDLRTIRERKV